jgi:hypothetical protein
VSNERRTQANRINAKASTGPRTSQGKARAARNARQHGLSLPALADPAWSVEINTLAARIAGDDADSERWQLACCIAAAHIDVMRVRQARHQMLGQALKDPNDGRTTSTVREESFPRKYGWRTEDERPERERDKSDTIETAGKYAKILVNFSAMLSLMDRYERRARSRLKFAVREFDAACVEALLK